jgi:uncharacterized membrane protein YuzA (DUF378 family)
MEQVLAGIAFIALIIGGINWGLQPFGIDLIAKLDELLTWNVGKWIKWFIGLSALYILYIVYTQVQRKI